MHYRMNNSNDYGHLRVRSNIVRLRGSQILSRVYLLTNILPTLGYIDRYASQTIIFNLGTVLWVIFSFAH